MAQDVEGTIYVNADQAKHQINKHIYGHFAEHLGRCVYDGFYVGESNTTIPHTDGVRNDIIKALQDLKIPNLRWPGGCFADTYHWKDGIGPKSERPSIVNRWWGGVTEDNSFGTHDFLNLCETLGAEPYISANVGSGTVQELIDWVQYANHDQKSPMADLRRENGRELPWKVKYWGVGNEAWGCGGNMTAEFYADVYRRYATFMAGWSGDQKIVRIASGASDDDYHWTEVLMKNVPFHLMEAVALHHYSVISWRDKGPSYQFTEDHYFTTMKKALDMERMIKGHVSIMDRYDPDNKVALMVDEWGGWYDAEDDIKDQGVLYQQNTMRDAMVAGMTLNLFNNYAQRIQMANIAQAVNVLQAVILTDKEKMILTPTYHVMKMYNVHQDATLIPTEVTDIRYEYNGESLPAMSASASRDESGNIHISVTNIDGRSSHKIQLKLRGMTYSQVSAQVLSSAAVQDHNTFEEPNKIQPQAFKDYKIKDDVMTISIPAFSVVVLEFK
jgi:alpha-L-arabinofuranosidase